MPDTTTRLNLTKPDTGNESWELDVERWADKLDESAAHYMVVPLGGEAIDEEVFFNDFLFDAPVAIAGVSLFARMAPDGAAFSIDFLKNGIEQGKTVSINIGQTTGHAAVTGLTYDPFAAIPEKLGLKVKGVGATEPGAEITVIIHFNVKPVP